MNRRIFELKIQNMVEDKINELFAVLQEEQGIESGDIDPWDALHLEQCETALTEIITKVIEYQMALRER